MGRHPAPAERLPASAFTVPVVELAAELGMSTDGIRADARDRSMETRLRRQPAHAKRVTCLQESDAQILREAHMAQRARPEDIPHWLSTAQAARALGLTLRGFQQRHLKGSLRGKLRHKRLYGPNVVGNLWRYHPEDIAREARRIGVRPRSGPRGTLDTPELARVGGVGRRTLDGWRRRGLPHVLDISGDAHYYPAQVVVWLEGVLARKHSRPAPAQRLLAALKALSPAPAVSGERSAA